MIGPKEIGEMFGSLPDRWKQDIKPEEAKEAIDFEALRALATKDITLNNYLGTIGQHRMFLFVKNKDEQNTFTVRQEWTPSFKWPNRKLHIQVGKRWHESIFLPPGEVIKVFCGGLAFRNVHSAKYFKVNNNFPKVDIKHPLEHAFSIVGNLQEITDEEELRSFGLGSIRENPDYKMSITEVL